MGMALDDIDMPNREHKSVIGARRPVLPSGGRTSGTEACSRVEQSPLL